MNLKHGRICFLLALWVGCLLPVAAQDCCGGSASVHPPQLDQIQVELVGSLLMQGEFEQAGKILSARSTEGSPRQFAALQALWEEYQTLRDTNRREDHQYYLAYLEQYQACRDQGAQKAPEEILDTVLKARDLAWETDRQALDDDPFVQEQIRNLRDKSRRYQELGEYERAWQQALRWVVSMHPEDKKLKTWAQELGVRRLIENSLTPDICPDQPDPYGLISDPPLQQAMTLMDENYVSRPDYEKCEQAVLRRSKLIGEALQTGRNDFLYAPDPNAIPCWYQEIARLEKESNEQESHTLESWKALIQSIQQANRGILQLPDGFLIYHLAQASLGELDPYTEIVWPTQSDEFDKRMTGQFAGVGIRITYDNRQLKIHEVIPNTPAAACGQFKPGDSIVAIDGLPSASLSVHCAVRQISGPVGSTVVLTIRRPGLEQDLDVPVERQKIVLPTLHGSASQGPVRVNDELSPYRIDPDPTIRYLNISSFGSKTAVNLSQLLSRFEKEGTRGLILDLRGNSGGLLDAAADVVDLFVDKGPLVLTQPRSGKPMRFQSKPDLFLNDVPVVVLIDQGSASGAEVVAGALRKAGRAILVGTRTYGKGTVQEVEPLNGDGSRIKYTRSVYQFADGSRVPNRYQMEKENKTDWGIRPDVKIELNGRQARRLRTVRQQLRSAAAENQLDAVGAEYMELVRSLIENDSQLAAALFLLKSRIIASNISGQPNMEANTTAGKSGS